MRLYDTYGWIIENNEFRNCYQAIGGKDMPVKMMVRRNLIVNTIDAAFYFAGQYGFSEDTITENIVYKAGIGFIIGGLGTGGALREKLFVYNNAFVNCRSFLVGWDDGYNTDCNFWNNIVYSDTALNIHQGEDICGRIVNVNKYANSSALTSDNYFIDNNCIFIPGKDQSTWFLDGNRSFNDISSWSDASGFDVHSISADPLFAGIIAEDFQITSRSGCKGTGKDGMDIGAYPRGNDGTIIGRKNSISTMSKKTYKVKKVGATQKLMPSLSDNIQFFDLKGRQVTLNQKQTHLSFLIANTKDQKQLPCKILLK